MSESVSPITMKCQICGGNLVNHYLTGTCVCANCGNKWSLEDLIPDFSKYASAITAINQAKESLDADESIMNASQVILMYKSATSVCALHHDAVGADLMNECKEGQIYAQKVKSYATAKDAFRRKNYRKAESEFEKIADFRDASELLDQCRKAHAVARKKQIPLYILVGTIIPLALCLFLYEKISLHLGIIIPLGIVLTALLAFVLYLDNDCSIVIKVLSFFVGIPLIIYLVLAYGFGLPVGRSATIAIVAPIAVVVFVAVLPERSLTNGIN